MNENNLLISMCTKIGKVIYLGINALLLYFSYNADTEVQRYIFGGLWIIHTGFWLFEEEGVRFVTKMKEKIM